MSKTIKIIKIKAIELFRVQGLKKSIEGAETFLKEVNTYAYYPFNKIN
ncbi:unnamed protein product [Paramecium primaurelia]|uniref:Uncharacterized protein n=1 Tax=Paramecium primaurelia TaxID=5886 RepID=A0A8S1LMW0_PARPR|nr:unnamed protein product [Paramecium primaurelia]